MALPARLALLAAVGVLAVVVLSTVTGFLPGIVSTIGGSLGGITDVFLKTPEPSVSDAPVPAAPTLVAPESSYTNQATAVLSGTVPLEVVGRTGYLVRIYVALADQEPAAIRDVPVGETPSFVVADLTLEKGRNDVMATVVGPGGESEFSPTITYILDQAKPKITITSPKNRATVNGETATIKGKVQARSTVVARNEANGTSATATAKSDGTFTLKVQLSRGTNGIALTATDPAGNQGTAVLTLRRGSGELTLALSASAYRVSQARLPRTITLTAQLSDPNGRPMSGERVSFTLTIPGVPAITGEDVTDSSGTATFRTTIPDGAAQGSGLATALVDTSDHGEMSSRISITIVK